MPGSLRSSASSPVDSTMRITKTAEDAERKEEGGESSGKATTGPGVLQTDDRL